MSPTQPSVLRLVRKQLYGDGFAVTNDTDLGLYQQVRDHIHRTYFTPAYLRRYDFDIPGDRERARDVIRYAWDGDQLSLREHDTIAIEGRGDQPFRRDFERVELLGDEHVSAWIATVLSLVPTEHRNRRGTFGVNMFRTHTQVVTKPHQDHEEYIVIYMLERVGSGAESQLYRVDGDELVHHGRLEPGDLIIFRDSEFRHTATPLVPPPGGVAHRDALVCTVNYPQTYPLPE
jgi:hypothetical protein